MGGEERGRGVRGVIVSTGPCSEMRNRDGEKTKMSRVGSDRARARSIRSRLACHPPRRDFSLSLSLSLTLYEEGNCARGWEGGRKKDRERWRGREEEEQTGVSVAGRPLVYRDGESKRIWLWLGPGSRSGSGLDKKPVRPGLSGG
jgi:hypothetical protein